MKRFYCTCSYVPDVMKIIISWLVFDQAILYQHFEAACLVFRQLYTVRRVYFKCRIEGLLVISINEFYIFMGPLQVGLHIELKNLDFATNGCQCDPNIWLI